MLLHVVPQDQGLRNGQCLFTFHVPSARAFSTRDLTSPVVSQPDAL